MPAYNRQREVDGWLNELIKESQNIVYQYKGQRFTYQMRSRYEVSKRILSYNTKEALKNAEVIDAFIKKYLKDYNYITKSRLGTLFATFEGFVLSYEREKRKQ